VRSVGLVVGGVAVVIVGLAGSVLGQQALTWRCGGEYDPDPPPCTDRGLTAGFIVLNGAAVVGGITMIYFGAKTAPPAPLQPVTLIPLTTPTSGGASLRVHF
jgi:hypothetical protein